MRQRDHRQGANKRYGDFAALDDVDFVVPAGSLTALLGPEWLRQSTLLRAIAGLDQPDTGTITINGRDVTNVPPQLAISASSSSTTPRSSI